MPENRAVRAALFVFTLLTLAAVFGSWFDLRRRLDAFDQQLTQVVHAHDRIERAVQLFRLERGSKGLGTTALIAQLRHWAPLLDLATTPQAQIAVVQERVDDILSAFQDIGRDAYDPLLEEMRRAEPGKDDALVRWLLQAMSQVDRDRSADVLVDCVRGFDLPVTARIRAFAAERLVDLNPKRAGILLSEVLGYETAAGVDSTRMPADLQARYAAAKVRPAPMRNMFGLVDTLIKAAPSDLEDRVLMVASRPGQDRMTVQTCVVHLGQMKSQPAVSLIKKLFEAPPEMTINPIFQNHCLEAISKIEGAAACDFFREALRGKRDERVQAKLQDLIKQLCP